MFVRNVATLLSGTLVAQVIPLAIAPLLSRAYSPAEFGEYGLFVAISAMGGVLFSLRLDFAVSQAKSDVEASKILAVCLIVSAGIAFIVSVIGLTVCWALPVDSFLNRNLYLLIFAVIFSLVQGNIQSLVYYLNRLGCFKQTAKLKVVQGVGGAVVMLLSSSLELNGLILGHLIGGGVAYGLILFSTGVRILSVSSVREVFLTVKNNRVYPLFSLPGTFANTVYLQSPLLYVEAIYDTLFLGFFTLVNRYVAGPLSLLSVASSQVLLKELVGVSSNRAKLLFWRLVLVNSAIALLFYFVCYLIGERGIVLLFGENWRGAYPVMLLLNISVSVRFIVSPLSVVLVRSDNVRLASVWQFSSLAFLFGFMLLFEGTSFISFLGGYVLLDCLLYTLYFFFILRGLSRY